MPPSALSIIETKQLELVLLNLEVLRLLAAEKVNEAEQRLDFSLSKEELVEDTALIDQS